MSERRYKAVLNRNEVLLLPARVEDYVSEQNDVRAIDAYVNTLDLTELKFKHTHFNTGSGQPPYNPGSLLKLYLYGYQYSIRSSRKLERETQRNMEVIWLIEGLRPSYKTIADFRKNNAQPLRGVNRDFVMLCKELSLFGSDEVAVDGSFFKADARKSSIYTKKQLNDQLTALDKKIQAYQEVLAQQDSDDDNAGLGSLVEDKHLEEKIKRLQEKQAEKKALQTRLEASEDKQISSVDEDARLMKKRGCTTAGYNVQIAVESKHKLIVADDVSQEGNDAHQLATMLKKAQNILQSDRLTGLADSGYYEGNQLKECEDQNISVYVAIPDKTKAKKKQGCFTREDFSYHVQQDCYYCPQGNVLPRYGKLRIKNNKQQMRYMSKKKDCHVCTMRSKCLGEKSTRKAIERWVHEDVIERHKTRMEHHPETMKTRGSIVEHPFGTLKHRAGMHHFSMRGLEKCQGEFSLMTMVYNFTRVLNIIGVNALRDYCAQRRLNGQETEPYI